MRRYPALLRALATLGCCWAALAAAPSESQSRRSGTRPTLFVAPFTTGHGIDERLLASFTNDFETALVYSRCYDVLERRDIDQLIAQIRNEHALTGVRDLGVSAVGKLQGSGATAVVFGDVEDDAGSGEIVIRAKIESFDSTILWKNSVSLKRGVLNDRTSRVEAVKDLLDTVCASIPTRGVNTRSDSAPLTEDDNVIYQVPFGWTKRKLDDNTVVLASQSSARISIFAGKPLTTKFERMFDQAVRDLGAATIDGPVRTITAQEGFTAKFVEGSMVIDMGGLTSPKPQMFKFLYMACDPVGRFESFLYLNDRYLYESDKTILDAFIASLDYRNAVAARTRR